MAVDYKVRYKDCMAVLREISNGRSDWGRYSRKELIEKASRIVDQMREEDRFNAAVEAYVEEHYKDAICMPSRDLE